MPYEDMPFHEADVFGTDIQRNIAMTDFETAGEYRVSMGLHHKELNGIDEPGSMDTYLHRLRVFHRTWVFSVPASGNGKVHGNEKHINSYQTVMTVFDPP